MTHNFPVNSKLNFRQKDAIKVPILRLSRALAKLSQIPHVIFGSASQFSFEICLNQKFCFDGLFLSKVHEVWAKKKKMQELSFMTLNRYVKFG